MKEWIAILLECNSYALSSPETSPSRSDAAPAIRGLASASQAWFARGRCCLSPNCPPETPELSEFLERWSAPQARSETLQKLHATALISTSWKPSSFAFLASCWRCC